MSLFNVKVLTIFPELFPGPLATSVTGNALKKNLWTIESIDLRNFAYDSHKSVDDYPAGGGSGMVMKPDVLGEAIEHCATKGPIIYLSPRGKLLTQSKLKEILNSKDLVLICGRFEGIDNRVIEHYKIEEISIGDYVLSGGELAAYVLIDGCVRLIPGVLGNDNSISEESFAVGTPYQYLAEYPQYTKPSEWKGMKVPSILTSGHHEKIRQWRLSEAEEFTKRNRPDLWEKYSKGRK